MIISTLILYQLLLAGTLYFNKVLLSKIAKNLNAQERWKLLLDIFSHLQVRKVKRIFGETSSSTANYLEHLNDPNSNNPIMMIHEEPILWEEGFSSRTIHRRKNHNINNATSLDRRLTAMSSAALSCRDDDGEKNLLLNYK